MNSLSQNGILMTIALTVVVVISGSVLIPESVVIIVGLGSLVAVQLMQLLRTDAVAATTAAKVEEVKTALVAVDSATSAKLDDMAVVMDKTHILTNSIHGISLLATVTALEEVVELTHDPKRKAAVQGRLDIARQEYEDHQAKQAVVDSGGQQTDG